MEYEELINRLRFVVCEDNKWRLTAKQQQYAAPEITCDVHGLSVFEARRMIRNLINITRGPIRLIVIHGFTHGTAIKDMLAQECIANWIVSRFCPKSNPGETIMRIAA